MGGGGGHLLCEPSKTLAAEEVLGFAAEVDALAVHPRRTAIALHPHAVVRLGGLIVRVCDAGAARHAFDALLLGERRDTGGECGRGSRVRARVPQHARNDLHCLHRATL